MEKLFSFLKGAAIIRWGAIALKNLWPFLLFFIFWPEIDGMMSSFSWWRDYVSAVSQYVVTASNTVRNIPYLGSVFKFIDEAWESIKQRLLQLLY